MSLYNDLKEKIFKGKSTTADIVQTAITTTAQELRNELSLSSNQYSNADAEKIAAFYTCRRLKADILSTLPFKVYKTTNGIKTEFKEDYRYRLLHDEPNNYQNAQQLRSAMFWNMFTSGNGFSSIERDEYGKPISYEFIPDFKVRACAPYEYQLWYLIDTEDEIDGRLVRGHSIINSRNIYHYRNSTADGLWGQSPLDKLFLNLSTSYKGTKTIDNFYKNNLFLQKALKTTNSDPRLEEMIKKSQDDFEKDYMSFNPKKKVIFLPWNSELSDVAGTIQDGQILETIESNANQIATALGVPTILIGDSQGAKFNNVELLLNFFEATSLRVEADIVRRETEYKFFTRKERDSGLSAEFNFSQFAQSDNTARANNYRTYFSMGVLSPNDIASREGYSTYPEGDIHIINGGGQTVEQMASGNPINSDNLNQGEINNLKDEITGLKTSIQDIKSNLDI